MNTLGAETFARRKIHEIFAFRVLNFREWTEKLIFFVVLSIFKERFGFLLDLNDRWLKKSIIK